LASVSLENLTFKFCYFFFIQINKRGVVQRRVLLITDKAIYNMKPKSLDKCQRRIGIEKLGSISSSQTSNEFVLHIPTEVCSIFFIASYTFLFILQSS
jgi:hypothetical protein